MIKKVFGALLLIFSAFTVSFSQNQAQEKWVDSVYQKMSLEARIGQLFIVPAHSGGGEEHIRSMQKLIADKKIGGLIFRPGDPLRQIQLTNKFQDAADIPLLIGMDMEWGLGRGLDSTITFPRQMSLGAIQNDSLIYAVGAEIARQMQVMGIHMNFAPLADISSNPDNPIQDSRSFGSNKRLVTSKAIAYMRGLQENGALACVKHFPGQGDTHQSASTSLPEVMHAKSRLDTMEIHPFQKLAYAGISAIMTGHIQVPSLENKKETPAFLSEKVVSIIRKEIQYDGLIISDALNMKAVTEQYKASEAAVLALQAGNDILMFPENIPESVRLIKKSLKRKKLSKQRFEESVKRVLRAKYKAGLSDTRRLNEENITLKLNRPAAAVLRNKLYEKAITVVRSKEDLLPIGVLDNKYFASLSFGNSGDFTRFLDKYAPFSHYDKKNNDEELLYNELQNYDVVVIGFFELEKEEGTYGITEEVLQFLKKLSTETEVIIAVFDSPFALQALHPMDNLICAYENNPYTQMLVPSAIFGGTSANGKLPVTVSDKLKFGQGIATEDLGRLTYSIPEDVAMDSRTLDRIDDIAYEAIMDKATPGCQVLVAKNGKVIFEKSYGYHRYDSLEPVTDQTIYDIASITKIMATMQAFMFLEERGLIDLDKKISVYLPDLVNSNKKNMIIRDILTHQAGLWPYLPFWKKTVEKSFQAGNYYKIYPEVGFEYQVSSGLFTSKFMQDSVWQWVKHSRIRDKEYRKPYDYKYSDLGYYLLQRLIENTINQPLEEFLRQNFYDPMGLTTMTYLPLCRFPLSRIAPTEDDDYFRKSLVYGMVHDEGAALCGGIAGHAGLFSNAVDLAKMMQMHLQDGKYGGIQFFQPGTIEKFTRKQYHNNRRGIGWDKPLLGEENGPTSKFSSAKTFGHTGFTGTAVWADPEFNLIYVFLSNRIHPDANNSKLIKNNIRTRIQDVIYESIWNYEQKYDSYKQ